MQAAVVGGIIDQSNMTQPLVIPHYSQTRKQQHHKVYKTHAFTHVMSFMG